MRSTLLAALLAALAAGANAAPAGLLDCYQDALKQSETLARSGEDITQAEEHYQQALDTIEGLRAGLDSKESKSTYMKNKLFVYDELIELLRSLHEKDPTKGYDRDALEIFERKQGRLFLEEMGQSGARNFAGLPEQVKSRESALENRLDKLQADLVKERSRPEADQARLQSLETEL